MFALILAALLVSGPPPQNPNSGTAERIVNEITTVLNDHKASGFDITVCVRSNRDVSVSGRLNSIDELKIVLDTIRPHADIVTVRIGLGCEPPLAPGPAELSLQRQTVH